MADTAETNGDINSSTLPRSAKRCRIPRLNRSTSTKGRNDRLDCLRLEGRPKSMTISTPKDFASWQQLDSRDLGSMTSMPFSMDDDSSVKSFGSFASFASSFASHTESRPISRNYYGKKYVLHCDRHLVKQEDYLTPTQRKDREIKQLKCALLKHSKEAQHKDLEIERLKAEVQHLQDMLAELQLGLKQSSMNSSQESDSLNAKTSEMSFESNESRNLVAVIRNDDSGVSLSPPDDLDLLRKSVVATADKAVMTDPVDSEQRVVITKCENVVSPCLSQEFNKFMCTYKRELEVLKSQHKEQYQDLKEKFNERVDDLLLKLTESNSRYLELRPLVDKTQDRILDIESQLSEVQKDMDNQEDYHNQMYIKMYRKGQASARLETEAEPTELLRQLRTLECELERSRGDRQAEYTLRFLKDAVFYYLTKRDKEHLKAIQSILGFTDTERMAVAKAMKHRRLFCSPFKYKK